MVDCKICGNPYCEHAGTQRGIVVSCNGYIEPKKPQTNADRIRAISDEELAAHFAALFVKWRKKEIDTNSVYAHPTEFAVLESIYYAWLMEHFRQPVKDGDNDG